MALSNFITVALKLRPVISGKAIVVNNQQTKRIECRVTDPKFFEIDYVFENQTNKELFDEVVSPVVDSFVNGYNGTVFLYGRSGSGKTYTMEGGMDANDPGIVKHTADRIFHHVNQQEKFEVSVSYIELYNELIFDLFDERKNISKTLTDGGPMEMKMKRCPVKDTSHVIELFNKHKHQRQTADTRANDGSGNARSSRSHAVLLIFLKSRHEDGIRSRVLNLVDLAGSEKLNSTNKERILESTSINNSLFTLGLVVEKLNLQATKKNQHIPYRDSKLSRLLKPSIGGNTKSVCICTISPTDQASIDTLKFAEKLKGVENKSTEQKPVPTADTVTFLKGKLKEMEKNIKEAQDLRKELEELMKLKDYTTMRELLNVDDSTITFDEDETIIHSEETSTIDQRHKKSIGEIFQTWKNVALKVKIQEMEKKLVEKDLVIEDLKNQLAAQAPQVPDSPTSPVVAQQTGPIHSPQVPDSPTSPVVAQQTGPIHSPQVPDSPTSPVVAQQTGPIPSGSGVTTTAAGSSSNSVNNVVELTCANHQFTCQHCKDTFELGKHEEHRSNCRLWEEKIEELENQKTHIVECMLCHDFLTTSEMLDHTCSQQQNSKFKCRYCAHEHKSLTQNAVNGHKGCIKLKDVKENLVIAEKAYCRACFEIRPRLLVPSQRAIIAHKQNCLK